MDKESVQATSPKAYDQVLEYLKTLIKNKDISYGGKIPSERELMETLGISRNSVREALRILEHTGVLESRHGKGNFSGKPDGRKPQQCFFHAGSDGRE